MSTLPNNHRPATAKAGYHETRMMSQGMYMWGQDVHIKEETDKQQLTLVAHSSIGNIRLVKREWKEDGKNRLVISSILSHQQAETGAYWYHCRWCRRLRIHPVTSRRNQYHRLEFRAMLQQLIQCNPHRVPCRRNGTLRVCWYTVGADNTNQSKHNDTEPEIYVYAQNLRQHQHDSCSNWHQHIHRCLQLVMSNIYETDVIASQ